MIPVLSAQAIREADAFTITHEPVASLDLMERASVAFADELLTIGASASSYTIFAGTGNNGGDALAVARILKNRGAEVQVFVVGDPEGGTTDFKANWQRLSVLLEISIISREDFIPIIVPDTCVIDGLLGSGLSRPVEGLLAEVIHHINRSGSHVVSIDMPSGLFADAPIPEGAVVRAQHTISFQVPKLIFFQPSAYEYVGAWSVVDIGLELAFLQSQKTNFYLTERSDIRLPLRTAFAHKGTAGRVLLVAGSRGKMGAATLSARAALRSGCGLLYIHLPRCGEQILQINVPEAMVLTDESEEVISDVAADGLIDVVAVGPGIGTDGATQRAVEQLILDGQRPMVLDADALNILSQNSYLLDQIPEDSILTPHPGEFKRLVGEWDDDLEKLELLRTFCQRYQVNVVLKGAYSAVCNKEGVLFFNPTGNPGMATGGSGDVLTGVIAGLLAQGMKPFEALRNGVFLHGLAGDMAARQVGQIPLIASDIVDHLPEAIKNLNTP